MNLRRSRKRRSRTRKSHARRRVRKSRKKKGRRSTRRSPAKRRFKVNRGCLLSLAAIAARAKGDIVFENTSRKIPTTSCDIRVAGDKRDEEHQWRTATDIMKHGCDNSMGEEWWNNRDRDGVTLADVLDYCDCAK